MTEEGKKHMRSYVKSMKNNFQKGYASEKVSQSASRQQSSTNANSSGSNTVFQRLFQRTTGQPFPRNSSEWHALRDSMMRFAAMNFFLIIMVMNGLSHLWSEMRKAAEQRRRVHAHQQQQQSTVEALYRSPIQQQHAPSTFTTGTLSEQKFSSTSADPLMRWYGQDLEPGESMATTKLVNPLARH